MESSSLLYYWILLNLISEDTHDKAPITGPIIHNSIDMQIRGPLLRENTLNKAQSIGEVERSWRAGFSSKPIRYRQLQGAFLHRS